MNLPLPGLALVDQMYVALQANGGGKHGTQALMLVLDGEEGVDEACTEEQDFHGGNVPLKLSVPPLPSRWRNAAESSAKRNR